MPEDLRPEIRQAKVQRPALAGNEDGRFHGVGPAVRCKSVMMASLI
jgi:hypothetical protein